MHSGKVLKWFPDTGFGFITPSDGEDNLFVHHSQIEGDRTELNVDENVTYTLGTNPKTGKPCAENVKGDKTGTRIEPSVKSDEPCYSYQRGTCTRGRRCRFSHLFGGMGRGRGGYGGGWGYGGGYGGYGGGFSGYGRGFGRGYGGRKGS